MVGDAVELGEDDSQVLGAAGNLEPEQALDGLPEGSHIGTVPKRLTLPQGQIYCHAENPLGELGYYLVSDGGNRPYRMKIRTPSFSNISVAAHMLRGAFVPDMIAILGSMFFVVGDIDR